MIAHLRDHECDRRIKFANVSSSGDSDGGRKSSGKRKDIVGVRITRSSRFVQVGGNEVSRLHRQTRSTGNGSLVSSIKCVTYREGEKNSRGAAEETCRGYVRGGRDRAGCNSKISKLKQPKFAKNKEYADGREGLDYYLVKHKEQMAPYTQDIL